MTLPKPGEHWGGGISKRILISFEDVKIKELKVGDLIQDKRTQECFIILMINKDKFYPHHNDCEIHMANGNARKWTRRWYAKMYFDLISRMEK